MWVHYSDTPQAESYLVTQESDLRGRRYMDIPVKTMSTGTLDGIFYLPKYDFGTTFNQFMDNIINIKFEYYLNYKPGNDLGSLDI